MILIQNNLSMGQSKTVMHKMFKLVLRGNPSYCAEGDCLQPTAPKFIDVVITLTIDKAISWRKAIAIIGTK